MQNSKIINFRWERFKHTIRQIEVNIKKRISYAFNSNKEVVPYKKAVNVQKNIIKKKKVKKF